VSSPGRPDGLAQIPTELYTYGMSNRFGGGHLDLANVIAALDGRPLQAEVEETWEPVEGQCEVRRGQIAISSTGDVYSTVTEAGASEVAFVHHTRRGVMRAGLAADRSQWITVPFPRFELCGGRGRRPPDGGDAIVEGLACMREEHVMDGQRITMWYAPEIRTNVRHETVTEAGRQTYALCNIRFDEPDPGLFE
jgi:hypothetical protein